MSQGNSFEMRLEELVDRFTSADLPAIRNSRLAALGEQRRDELVHTMETLDSLLDALHIRAEHIANGDIAPVEQDEFHSHEPIDADPSSDAQKAPATEPASVVQKPRDKQTEVRTARAAIDSSLPSDSDATPSEKEQAINTATEHVHDTDTVVLEASEDSDATTAQLEHTETEVPQKGTGTSQPAEEYIAPTPEADDPPSPGWSRRSELLYDDMLRLFRLGDSDGALISLERLLTSTPLNADLEEFVRVNEDRLLELYVAVLGTWASKPTRATTTEGPIPPAFLRFPKIATVLEFIDGNTSFKDIVASAAMTSLETTAVLSQLVRAKIIVVEES